MGNPAATIASRSAPLRGACCPEPLPEPELARRAANGCVESRNRLVETHLPYVIRLAREYRGLGLPLEDLIHEGALGLMEASRRFDAGRGHRFLTYATWWIRKSLRRALRRGGGVVAVPSYQRRRLREIRDAERDLRSALGRAPSEGELSDRLGRSVQRVRRTLDRRRLEVGLDAPAGERAGTTWADRLADAGDRGPESDVLRDEIRRRLLEALEHLDPRQRTVVSSRYGLDDAPPRSLQALSEDLGLSRERVRQIEVEAKRSLRRRLARERLAPVD